jgi:hypothetical protein
VSWFSIGAVTWYLLFYILSIIILIQGEAILFSPPLSRGDNIVFTSFKGRQYCSPPPSRGDNIIFTSSFEGRQYYFHLLLQGEAILFSPPPSRGDNTVFTSSFKGKQYCFHLLQGETILFSSSSSITKSSTQNFSM